MLGAPIIDAADKKHVLQGWFSALASRFHHFVDNPLLAAKLAELILAALQPGRLGMPSSDSPSATGGLLVEPAPAHGTCRVLTAASSAAIMVVLQPAVLADQACTAQSCGCVLLDLGQGAGDRPALPRRRPPLQSQPGLPIAPLDAPGAIKPLAGLAALLSSHDPARGRPAASG